MCRLRRIRNMMRKQGKVKKKQDRERERERERQAERKEEPARVVPECSISLIVVMTTAGEELEDTLINRL